MNTGRAPQGNLRRYDSEKEARPVKIAVFGTALSLALCASIVSSWGADLNSEMARARALEARANGGDPAAQTDLARIYLLGPKEMRNEGKGMEWLKRAAQKDYGAAEYLYGMVLLSGKGDTSKMQEGGNYLTRSAAHGCAGAAGLLGNMLLAAASKNPDAEPKAIAYVKQAAEGGDYMSQGLLAKVYSTGGRTVARDPVAAYAWLEFARSDRPDHAFAARTNELHAQLRANLDASQLKRAAEMATGFKKKYGKEKYEFCSQSLPEEMQAGVARR